jgi:hypothetical protein
MMFIGFLIYFGAVLIPALYFMLTWRHGSARRPMLVGVILQCFWSLMVWAFVYGSLQTGHVDYYWGWAFLIPVNLVGALYYLAILIIYGFKATRQRRAFMSANLKYGLCVILGFFAPFGGLLLLLFFGRPIAILMFPYYTCSEYIALNRGAAILMFVTLLEWPLNGIVLADGLANGRFKKTACILASIHAVAIIVAIWFVSTHPALGHYTNWSMG